MREKDMVKVAAWINEVIEEVAGEKLSKDREERSEYWKKFKSEIVKSRKLLAIAREVKVFCNKFPVPGID
jgi:glycine/serine hydroxymethyltransferase